MELVSNAFDLEHRNIQDTFYANDKALVQMDTLRFGQLCLGILSLFSNTSAVDICSCVYLITCQALHSPTFRPHAQGARENLEYKILVK